MNTKQLQDHLIKVLKEYKANEISLLDVSKITSVTDTMIICSATSNRHAQTLANYVVAEAKKNGVKPLGVEGEREADWILVDLVDIIIHIMLPQVRAFYNLEKLWSVDKTKSTAVSFKN